MTDIRGSVDQKIINMCNTGECSISHSICVQDVVNAIEKLKLSKADANFKLLSDNLLYGCHELFIHLSMLFNCMFQHGYCPRPMNLSSLIPIPKSTKKSIGDSGNYRAIALGSIIGKILDNVIMFKNIKTLCTNDLQFGFKPKQSTTQCSFVLHEIIDLYERNDSSLYLILLDASQAFDRVKYCKLFDIMLKRNGCSYSLRLLINMYTSQRLRVKWGNTVCDEFTCLNGVKTRWCFVTNFILSAYGCSS